MFEASILQNIYNQKPEFLFHQAIKILENNPFVGSRPITNYYTNETMCHPLAIDETYMLFYLLLYCLLVSSLVLLFENIVNSLAYMRILIVLHYYNNFFYSLDQTRPKEGISKIPPKLKSKETRPGQAHRLQGI